MEEGDGKEGLRIVRNEGSEGEGAEEVGDQGQGEDWGGGVVWKLEVEVPVVVLDGDVGRALERLGDFENAVEEWSEYLRLGDAAAWVLYGRICGELELVHAVLCGFLNRKAFEEGEDDDGSGGGGEVGG